MTVLFAILLFVIFIACVAFLYTEGMWSNAIRLVNVVTAALLATNFFEPVAARATEWNASYTAMWDFLALWGLFSLFMVIFRTITDLVSRVNVRFPTMADRIGSGLFAAWIGWVMVCFALMTLHTAPLAKNFFFGAFQPDQAMFFGMLHPDRQWLGFMQKESAGGLCRSATEEEREENKYVFDPDRRFITTYSDRRAALEAYMKKYSALRINPKAFEPDARPGAPPRNK